MPLNDDNSHGTQPPPSSSKTGHPLPRRTSPANSVTLRHHRLTHDASRKAGQGSGPGVKTTTTSSPRRNSSGDSHETGQSDPKTWFEQSNQNPTATFDSNVMEVDPPFFQKESDSSNEEKTYYNHHQLAPPKLTATRSSSADDYRSVIDDLTVEIQKLREELKRYKNTGPDMLRKEKLFEIKVHGLPKKKKRELEATLRDFAASLDGSPNASSMQNKKKSRHTSDNLYSGSGSKHASSSSGSNFRPADSAYASMSTGANSGTSLNRPSIGSQAKSSEAVENYLRDIPEGLYPRHMIMTDKERKKLVVRRLEQLFTGKIGGRHVVKKQPVLPSGSSAALAPVVAETQPNVANTSNSSIHEPPTLQTSGKEPTREARILPLEQQSGHSGKKSRSADNGSASHSNGDNTESGGNGNSTGSGTNPSPPMTTLPEQRPTRPRDLDPDRTQVPAENMDYIRHLGLVPPELLAEQHNQDVHPDAEGWVYLNLLCNLAQLHMINVTPDFVRSAVSGISTKFQLSPDGRKIRWRGGTEGTRFSSDSSGYNSQKSPSTDDTEDGSENKRKRQKTGRSTGDEFQSGSSSKNGLKFDPQLCAPSESFHYKPLFAQQDSSGGQTSLDETVSSFGPPEESNVGESRWGLSGSGASSRRKRRHDGAIIYYSGAPFCTDLSGDPGDMSPTTQMRTSGQTQSDQDNNFKVPPSPLRRTDSGSFLSYRPLTDRGPLSTQQNTAMDIDSENPPSLADDADDVSEVDLDFTWTDNAQYMQHFPLEPCGLGGVLPEDHFMVVVSTKRPKQEDLSSIPRAAGRRTSENTDGIICRLATMSTSSPVLGATKPLPAMDRLPVEIEYMSGRIKRLTPVSLPPPAIFFPPFSPTESTADDDDTSDDMDMSSSLRNLVGQRTVQRHSDGYPDGVDLSSGDEEGDEPDDSPNQNIYDVNRDPKALPNRPRQATRRTSSAAAAAGTARGASKSNSADPAHSNDNSSMDTAGAIESGYSSSEESS
ncbi:putative period clock protein FRQ [Fusarium austroafricanum]|uniref:Putative period clock protein FRQ n=1 Tax=Fusarium austroafricanum TaxID=2364996 RepID=A0A8H4KGI6_9HYPO|nr:putative period clock protein FRQ [Fusarium austroafricanum]